MDAHGIRLVLRRSAVKLGITSCALVVAAALSGCSSGSSSGGGTTPPPVASTQVQINMGDSPADWMLAFTMNISSMSMVRSDGSTTVISTPTTIEMLHLMGTMQPVTMVKLPQGTYTGASLAISSADMSYMDPNTFLPTQATISGPINANITFASPVTVGTTPMAIGFDLDLANSVMQGSGGSFSMSPVFNVTSGVQGSGNPMDPMNGGIQEMMGTVSGVSGSGFTMTSMQAAQNFTFNTNSTTVFDGTSMGSMANGMVLFVDATLQADGSLLATRVQSMMGAGGAMGGGIITALSGTPPTSFTMVMQNGAGSGMMSTMFADGVTVSLSGTTYDIDDDNVDMNGLPFTPVFDANDMYLGQNVMPISTSGMMSTGMGGGMMGSMTMAGSMTATKLLLEPQGLSGTIATPITGGAVSSFTLTLPASSAFTTLTGVITVTVYQQLSTVVTNQATTPSTSSIPSGSTVHVFGLLFNDGGKWKMVAARIGSN